MRSGVGTRLRLLSFALGSRFACTDAHCCNAPFATYRFLMFETHGSALCVRAKWTGQGHAPSWCSVVSELLLTRSLPSTQSKPTRARLYAVCTVIIKLSPMPAVCDLCVRSSLDHATSPTIAPPTLVSVGTANLACLLPTSSFLACPSYFLLLLFLYS